MLHPMSNGQRNGHTVPMPRVGDVIRQLRQHRGLSLRDLATQSGLSQSFLGAVERGRSDISVGRLAQVAAVLGHDVASLLGYSLRQTNPVFVQPEEHVTVDRGEGTELRAFRIPSTNLEFMVATFGPRAKFADAVTHAGLDVMYVAEGALVLVVDGVDYPLGEGECAVWPSSHAHTVRNDADQPARAIGFTTETVY
jgi:transcriptional regulator with XRE-family HTH domain